MIVILIHFVQSFFKENKEKSFFNLDLETIRAAKRQKCDEHKKKTSSSITYDLVSLFYHHLFQSKKYMIN